MRVETAAVASVQLGAQSARAARPRLPWARIDCAPRRPPRSARRTGADRWDSPEIPGRCSERLLPRARRDITVNIVVPTSGNLLLKRTLSAPGIAGRRRASARRARVCAARAPPPGCACPRRTPAEFPAAGASRLGFASRSGMAICRARRGGRHAPRLLRRCGCRSPRSRGPHGIGQRVAAQSRCRDPRAPDLADVRACPGRGTRRGAAP